MTEEELKRANQKLDLTSVVTKLNLQKNKAGEEAKNPQENTIDIVFDRSQKEMGTLMKLNSL